jgi:hypothetical protein
VAVVLIARVLQTGQRTAASALLELALYVVVTVAATVVFERDLLREMAGYMRRPVAATADQAT